MIHQYSPDEREDFDRHMRVKNPNITIERLDLLWKAKMDLLRQTQEISDDMRDEELS